MIHRFEVDTPVILVESATDDSLSYAVSPLPSSYANKITSTKWHQYSNEAIDSALSALGTLEPNSSDHPLHDALKILSSAVHKLSTARAELEEGRKALIQKEAARRARAEQLIRELQPSERDLARRVVQSLFPDDDEDSHAVRRKYSASVSDVFCFCQHDSNRIHPVTVRVAVGGSRGRCCPCFSKCFRSWRRLEHPSCRL